MKNIPSLQSLIDKTAIQSWSWYHYIFLYAIMPIIILILPLLGFDNFFILDICHPTFLSMYMSNFNHVTLPHLSANLALYLLSVTGILFMEKDKIRFRTMLAFLFVILPIVASISYIGYMGNICTVQGYSTTYGFSTISLSFIGYAVYLFLFLLIPHLFKKIEEGFSRSITGFIDSIALIIFINISMVILIILFGIAAGLFSSATSASLNNGFAHSVGFVTGIFFPMIMELKKECKLDPFHRTLLIHFGALIIFLTVYLAFFYFVRIA
jgi:MFS family permease